MFQSSPVAAFHTNRSLTASGTPWTDSAGLWGQTRKCPQTLFYSVKLIRTHEGEELLLYDVSSGVNLVKYFTENIQYSPVSAPEDLLFFCVISFKILQNVRSQGFRLKLGIHRSDSFFLFYLPVSRANPRTLFVPNLKGIVQHFGFFLAEIDTTFTSVLQYTSVWNYGQELVSLA